MSSFEFLTANASRRGFLKAGLATAVVGTSLSKGASAWAAAEPTDTIEPGVVKVGVFSGGMPYVGQKEGELIGFEGELMKEAARTLGLRVEASETTFATLLANVQSRRVDVGMGTIGWNKVRCQSALFTDPPYYSPLALATRPGVEIKSVQDLSGKTAAVAAGGWWAPGLKYLNNVNTRVYDSLPAMGDDLAAGRVDVILYDPLPLVDMKSKRPDLNMAVKYVPAPSDEYVKSHPGSEVFLPYMTGWYVPKESPKLADAFTKIIRSWYATGYLSEAIKKAGSDPAAWLKPSPSFAAQRVGVDRPAGWAPPTI
jgi:polar amino acid transport system substrate-binding protein